MAVLNKQPQAYKFNNLGANPLDKIELIQDFMAVLITCKYYEQIDQLEIMFVKRHYAPSHLLASKDNTRQKRPNLHRVIIP